MLSTRTSQMNLLRQLVPAVSLECHKGDAGRIGVIGGCEEYTGAPYFAAAAALRVGADLSHVFCTKDAAAVIKAYSPDLIVHPVLDSPACLDRLAEWFARLHSFVLGPGLGRSLDASLVAAIVAIVRQMQKPLVVDADGLYYVTENTDLVVNYPKAVLTPNIVELRRLADRVIGRQSVDNQSDDEAIAKAVAATLGVNLLCKGKTDVITDGQLVVRCDWANSPRRCGGQGDLLAGSLGTFLHWAHLPAALHSPDSAAPPHLPPCLAAAFAAAVVTRDANKTAFSIYNRAALTADMLHELPLVAKRLLFD